MWSPLTAGRTSPPTDRPLHPPEALRGEERASPGWGAGGPDDGRSYEGRLGRIGLSALSLAALGAPAGVHPI